jgi:sugar/nucleoside kinase (ribokinase family)
MRFPTKPLTWTTEMPESPESAPSGSGDLPVYDLVVPGDVVPDIIVGDVVGEIAFGHVETLVERGTLTVGGSAAIMACGAARLGLRVAFVGVVGNDPAGRFILEEVGRRGVDTSACVVLPGRPPG